MKPTIVHRYLFSKEEIVAAMFDNALPCDFRDIRIEDDEVIIEFINPRTDDTPEAIDASAENEGPGEDFPGDLPPDSAPELPPPERPQGQNEQEARDLCSQRIFQTFLEVKTEEAAFRVLLDRCRAKALQELDTVKSWRANFRDVVAEFEMWMRE